jgi:hypothetical protein
MKHEKAIKAGICKYLGVRPEQWVRGCYAEIFEEEFDMLQDRVFLYLKKHKNAYKEVGRGRFGNTNIELHLLSGAILMRHGLTYKIEK